MAGGQTLLVNPGTVGGIKAPATYVVGNLDTMEFSIREIALSYRREGTAG
jgi:predicted phosphodiesterase